MRQDLHPQAVIVHSSDLHLGTDDSFSDRDSLAVLPKVLNAARETRADIVLLAGDTFDNHRQPGELLERAAQMLRIERGARHAVGCEAFGVGRNQRLRSCQRHGF